MNTAILLIGLIVGGAPGQETIYQDGSVPAIRVSTGSGVATANHSADFATSDYFAHGSNASTVVAAPIVHGSSCESPGCATGCGTVVGDGCGCQDCCGNGCGCCLLQYKLTAPTNMFPHTPYMSEPKTYYYFRPYHWSHIMDHQAQAGAWGATPANPYSNTFFDDLYETLEIDE